MGSKFRSPRRPLPRLSMRPLPGRGNPGRCVDRSREEMGRRSPWQSRSIGPPPCDIAPPWRGGLPGSASYRRSTFRSVLGFPEHHHSRFGIVHVLFLCALLPVGIHNGFVQHAAHDGRGVSIRVDGDGHSWAAGAGGSAIPPERSAPVAGWPYSCGPRRFEVQSREVGLKAIGSPAAGAWGRQRRSLISIQASTQGPASGSATEAPPLGSRGLADGRRGGDIGPGPLSSGGKHGRWPICAPTPKPLSKFGCPLQSVATQDGCSPAEAPCNRGDFLESGKTLNVLGPTGAIIRDRDHICAPPAP